MPPSVTDLEAGNWAMEPQGNSGARQRPLAAERVPIGAGGNWALDQDQARCRALGPAAGVLHPGQVPPAFGEVITSTAISGCCASGRGVALPGADRGEA